MQIEHITSGGNTAIRDSNGILKETISLLKNFQIKTGGYTADMPKNKADCPRFLIADNPMADEFEYVYHSQQPRFLARRVLDSPTTDFIIVDDIDDMANYFKGDVSKIAGLMRRLGDWYVFYLKWERENNEF